ncbi:MAG: ATP-binding cassette domain-containing protein [Planctomycetia bacterium]|nr:ATP-binding cassette domain-containing protein [Planctomycetia bacterium]
MTNLKLMTPPPAQSALSHLAFDIRLLSKTYPGWSTSALAPLTVQIPANACVAVLGPSGAGKSTLLHILGLLDQADPDPVGGTSSSQLIYRSPRNGRSFDCAGNGHGQLAARDERLVTESQRDMLRGSEFGFVFQHAHLLRHLPCHENVAVGLALQGIPAAERRKQAVTQLRSLDLEDKAHRLARNLSGGEIQRVAVLRALAHSPSVAFADEPTAHLDQKSAGLVMQQLTEWQRRGTAADPHTLLLVTHNTDLAFEHCQYFLLLAHGELIAGGMCVKAGTTPVVSVGAEISTREELAAKVLQRDPPEPRSAGPIALELAAEKPVVPLPMSPIRRKTPSIWRLFPFLLWLAWRGTWRREGRLATIGAVLVLSLLTAECVIGWGLLRGKERLLQRELDTPLAKKLDVKFRDPGKLIDDALIRRLKSLQLTDGRRSKAAFTSPDQQVKRWNTAQYLFKREGELSPIDYLIGRSVELDDPLLRDLVFLPGPEFQGFSHGQSREILVTAALLRECNLNADAGAIYVASAAGSVEMKIVGVVESLPGNAPFQFIIPDGLYQQIKSGHGASDPTVDAVELSSRSGRLLTALLENMEELIPRYLDARVENEAIQLTVTGGRKKWSDLERTLKQVRLELEKQGLALPDDLHFEPSFKSSHSSVVTGDAAVPAYAFASLYVDRVEDLDTLAPLVADQGVEILDKTFLLIQRRLRNVVAPLRTMLIFFVLVAAVIATLNTGLSVGQRIRGKRAETSILKAVGMRRWQLLAVYSLEGLILGILAAAISAVMAYATGNAIALRIVNAESASAQSGHWWWQLPDYLAGRMASEPATDLFSIRSDWDVLLAVVVIQIAVFLAASVWVTLRSTGRPTTEGIKD